MADLKSILRDARVVARFWEKVRPAGSDQCWEWRDPPDTYGYGRLGYFTSKSESRPVLKAHRISAALFLPDYSEGLVVRHKCDNAICCNPAHLEMGTQAENIIDREKRGRGNHDAKLADIRAIADARRGVPRSEWAEKPGKNPHTQS